MLSWTNVYAFVGHVHVHIIDVYVYYSCVPAQQMRKSETQEASDKINDKSNGDLYTLVLLAIAISFVHRELIMKQWWSENHTKIFERSVTTKTLKTP